MEELIARYRQFRRDTWPQEKPLLQKLAVDGQRPWGMVISCSDSRVDPQTIFSAGPGDLFVVRNVANLVPPYAPDSHYHGTSAALEFGVRVLQVRNLIVLGHTQCGGVHALLHGTPDNAADFVGNWMSIARRARERALVCDAPDQMLACEQEVLRVSLENLRSFPWIRAAEESGTLNLRAGYFDIHAGVLVMLDKNGTFTAID